MTKQPCIGLVFSKGHYWHLTNKAIQGNGTVEMHSVSLQEQPVVAVRRNDNLLMLVRDVLQCNKLEERRLGSGLSRERFLNWERKARKSQVVLCPKQQRMNSILDLCLECKRQRWKDEVLQGNTSIFMGSEELMQCRYRASLGTQ